MCGGAARCRASPCAAFSASRTTALPITSSSTPPSRSNSRSVAPARAAAQAMPTSSAASTMARCSASKCRTGEPLLNPGLALHGGKCGDGGAGRRVIIAEDALPRVDDLLLQPIGLVGLAHLPQDAREIAHRGERIAVFLAPYPGHRDDRGLQQFARGKEVAFGRDRAGEIVQRPPSVTAILAPDFGRQLDNARLQGAGCREVALHADRGCELTHRLQRVGVLFTKQPQPRGDDLLLQHSRRAEPAFFPQQFGEIEHHRQCLGMLLAPAVPQLRNALFLLCNLTHSTTLPPNRDKGQPARDCFASLAMTATSCHCEERSDEAISFHIRRPPRCMCAAAISCAGSASAAFTMSGRTRASAILSSNSSLLVPYQ